MKPINNIVSYGLKVFQCFYKKQESDHCNVCINDFEINSRKKCELLKGGRDVVIIFIQKLKRNREKGAPLILDKKDLLELIVYIDEYSVYHG